MGSLHIHEFMSLDGVVSQPTWTFEYGWAPKMGDRIATLMGGAKGILLGRRTYEMFEPVWSNRTAAEDPGAPFFNDTPKFVVSATLARPTWRNSEGIGAYDPVRIFRLKEEVGDLYVSGSITLVRAMLADGLVDELHLYVYPLTLGAGPRLFTDGAPPLRFSLALGESYENGVVYASYRRATP